MNRLRSKNIADDVESVKVPRLSTGSSHGTIMDRPNPMAILLIVERLFEIMPFNLNDFKNFRLVSKLWWEVSLPTFRENAWLSLTENTPTDSSFKDHVSPIQSYKNWLKLSNDPYQLTMERKPFTKYIIGCIDMCLWRQIGETMTHLKLSQAKFKDRDDMCCVLYELTPNLTCLFLESFQFTNGPIYDPNKICWEQNFRYPANQINNNLKCLDITFTVDVGIFIIDPKLTFCLYDVLPHFPNLKVMRLYIENTRFEGPMGKFVEKNMGILAIRNIRRFVCSLRGSIIKEFCSQLKIELFRAPHRNRILMERKI